MQAMIYLFQRHPLLFTMFDLEHQKHAHSQRDQ